MQGATRNDDVKKQMCANKQFIYSYEQRKRAQRRRTRAHWIYNRVIQAIFYFLLNEKIKQMAK